MRFGDEGELRLCLGSWGQLLPGFTWPLRMHGIIRILSNVPELNRYDTFLTKEIYILHTWPLILYILGKFENIFTRPLRMHGIIRILSNVTESDR